VTVRAFGQSFLLDALSECR